MVDCYQLLWFDGRIEELPAACPDKEHSLRSEIVKASKLGDQLCVIGGHG
jgi:hypothetical protein